MDGSAFVEVLKDGSLVYLGRLPSESGNSMWSDAKVVGDHAVIVSEAGGHGMQVFDMKTLLTADPKPPKTYGKEDLNSLFKGWGNCHNVIVNEKTKTAFCGGDSKCSGKLHAVNLSDPKNPNDDGCVRSHSYSLDAECVIYDGIDRKFNGREICFGYNEKQLVISDITDRASPKQLSTMTYKGLGYTHQGWLATKDMRYLLMGDELHERMPGPKAGHTATYIVDVKDLTKPVVTGIYHSPHKAIDHNLYVIDGLAYMSNYNTGLRIVNVSSIAQDPTGAGFKEILSFDVYPEDDAKEELGFVGAWSVYPFFKSGHILINSIERGVFSVKRS